MQRVCDALVVLRLRGKKSRLGRRQGQGRDALGRKQARGAWCGGLGEQALESVRTGGGDLGWLDFEEGGAATSWGAAGGGGRTTARTCPGVMPRSQRGLSHPPPGSPW